MSGFVLDDILLMRPAALGLLLVLSAFGQAQKGAYSLNGIVRNSVTGEPVRSALVVLEAAPSRNQARSAIRGGAEKPQTKAALSGPGGEFHFEGLSEGQYSFVAQKPGFMGDENPWKSGMLVIPQPQADAALRVNLTPLGTIEGKVVNQYDEPLENVVLTVYSLAIIDGEKSAFKVGTVWTDDRGQFLLTQVMPGKYCVKAEGMRGGTETHFGTYAMRYAPWESFSPIYFGGATDIASAALIPVAAGTRARADFRLDMQPSFRIRGKVEGYTASETVSFELLQGGDRTEPSRALLDVTTGKFEILDVPPGTYKLRAAQEKMRGEVMVNIGSADFNDVSITLLPAATIKGSSRSVLGPVTGPQNFGFCEVILNEPWYAYSFHTPSPRADDEIVIEDMFPGEYQVRLSCNGAYPQSATLGGVDLLTNRTITISPGVSMLPIVIEYRPGGGTLKVKFGDQVPEHVAVLLVPAFPASNGPMLQSTTRSVAGQAGEDMIPFSNLAPGEYSVYGLAPSEDAEFRNPKFLRALSGAARVHIEDGKTAEVTITSISK